MINVKVGDTFHVKCDWATGGLMEGIIQIIKRPHGRIHYRVLKSISQFKDGEELVGSMHEFFGGTIWTSKRISKKEINKHPEYYI
jgi:hypothetical protein